MPNESREVIQKDGTLYYETYHADGCTGQPAIHRDIRTGKKYTETIHTFLSCSCSFSLSKNDRLTLRLFDDGGNASVERGGSTPDDAAVD